MARCAFCSKKTIVGNSVSHSGIRTKRLFRPNLHKYHGRVYCTKCLRKFKKEEKTQKPAVSKEAPAQPV